MADELTRGEGARERAEDSRPEPGGGTSTAVAPPPPDDRAAAPAVSPFERPKKLSKKERRLLKDNHRPLDSWERYRALTDVLDEHVELVDLADHKARFALVIMAALNVLLFFVGARTDLAEDLPGNTHVWLAGYLVIYVMVALYFFLQAIESLRPRKEQPHVPYMSGSGGEEHPQGVRFYEDILSRDVDSYRRSWRDLHIGQLNNEVAVQIHAMSAINHAKYNALRRLYMGLKIMTVMAVGMVGLALVFAFIGTARAGQHGRKNADVLGTPTRVETPGVKEPSGVAFHPAFGHLFVVGDEGSLAEYDLSGKAVRGHRVSGNLEDLTVHGPSGSLLLLDEQASELTLYDPNSRRPVRKWKLDRNGLLGQDAGGRNDGFEGIAFREEAGRPAGGVFYLAHQRDPAMLVALTIDLHGAAPSIGAESVVGRWPLPGHGDLTAVTFSPALQRLLLAAEAEDRLLVVGADGSVQNEIPLPGQQQEGLAFDAQGNLWVADDQDKTLLRMDGAIGAISGFQRNPGGLDPFAQPQQRGGGASPQG